MMIGHGGAQPHQHQQQQQQPQQQPQPVVAVAAPPADLLNTNSGTSHW
jgi:hypothetical protein